MYRSSHQLISLFGVAVNLWLAVQQEEDPVGGETSLGVVGSKRSCLTSRHGTENQSNEDTEDVLKGLVSNIALRKGDLEGTEAKDDGVHEVDDCLGERIRESVHD